jgi:carbonic anhydrase
MNPFDKSAQPGPSRRKFLGASLAGTAAGLLGAASGTFIASEPVFAQSTATPDEALKALLDGNERFMAEKILHNAEDLQILRGHTIEKQEPFAAVLACADSRVPVELIFDQSIGHVFLTRVAGNIVTPEIIASLEYGAAVLGIKTIVVLGHANCGAVKAAIQGKEVPGQISALFHHLRPAVDHAGPDVVATTKANATIQAALLSKASTVLAPMVKEGKLKIVAAYYDLGSGKVSLV